MELKTLTWTLFVEILVKKTKNLTGFGFWGVGGCVALIEPNIKEHCPCQYFSFSDIKVLLSKYVHLCEVLLSHFAHCMTFLSFFCFVLGFIHKSRRQFGWGRVRKSLEHGVSIN